MRSSSKAIISVWIEPRTISPPRTLIGLGSQSIYASLQVRAEFFVTLAVEVLELVKDEDVSSFSHRLQQLRKLKKVVGSRISVGRHLECFQCVVHRREDTGWLGVGYLYVEDRLLAADFLHRFLNERRLADATAARNLGEEPAFAVEHPLQIRKLLFATVEFPVGHVTPSKIKPLYQKEIKPLYLILVIDASRLWKTT